MSHKYYANNGYVISIGVEYFSFFDFSLFLSLLFLFFSLIPRISLLYLLFIRIFSEFYRVGSLLF